MLGLWNWYDHRSSTRRLQQELAQRLAAADAQGRESGKIAAEVRETVRESQVKLGVLETRLAESQNQQLALEAMYQELARARDETVLADVEQTLLVANQQLQVAGNVKAALIAPHPVRSSSSRQVCGYAEVARRSLWAAANRRHGFGKRVTLSESGRSKSAV